LDGNTKKKVRKKKASGQPLPSFNTLSSMAVVVGIVVGIGIFRLPSIVAAHSVNEFQYISFWVIGGFISLMGALCYAELSSSMPNSGGEYHFLSKAFGPATGFFLSWGRMTVIQTGSVALIAFIFGDYASVIYNLGPYSSSIYAALTIILLTSLNIAGTVHSRRVQNILASVIVLTLVVISLSGFISISDSNNQAMAALGDEGGSIFAGGGAGLAMIFVLLTYGGWSEAAYLTGEIHNVRRDIVKALVVGILIITTLYVLINLSYLHVLGFDAMIHSETIGFDLAEKIFGTGASVVVVMIVIVSALSTANATIITGARTNYAIGRDYRMLGFLGKWNTRRNTPVNALLLQGSIAMVLVGLGAWSKQTVTTMVDYTAPVFWFFLLLTTLSLFVFRYRKNHNTGSYRVPLYPIPPVLFTIVCIYMLYSSLNYTGYGALAGASILLVGVPVYFFARKYEKNSVD
jgi:basic amino acid/polyamine antiporter, APA family